MSNRNQEPDPDDDELDIASHVNFRDYPSTGLVVFAALSSGLGWMLYRWLGKKRKGQAAGADEPDKAEPEDQTGRMTSKVSPSDP